MYMYICMYRVWGRILGRLTSAVFKCKGSPQGKYTMKEDLFEAWKTRFVSIGLDKSAAGFNFKSKQALKKRLRLVPAVADLKDHWKMYNHLDVALDPFPYTGTTTTVDALLMGVPVVTLCERGADARHSHNVTASILAQAGLHELIADSEDEYVGIALGLAENPARLATLRTTLRERILASPLCHGERASRNLEAAYRDMWTRFCNGNEQDHKNY